MFGRSIIVWMCALCVVAGGMAFAQGRGGAPSPEQSAQLRSGETYLWHGEVVGIEGGTRTLTVRARLLREAAADVERFSAGDRVLLMWSGQDIHAGAVRRVLRHDAAQRIAEFFALPVELASRDVQGDSVTIRIRVAEASMAAIKVLKTGNWVSVTARQRPMGEADAIAAVTPYIRSEN